METKKRGGISESKARIEGGSTAATRPSPPLFPERGIVVRILDATDCLRELKKIKLAWPELNYTTAPGVLILLPSTPTIAPVAASPRLAQ